jgi:lytic murein transglycosylase
MGFQASRLSLHSAALGALMALCVPMASAQTVDDNPLASCITRLRDALPAYPKVTAASFDTYTRNAQDLRPVIEKASASQPEFKLPIWDYLARLVDDLRVTDGRRMLALHADALAAIHKRFGVDPATVVAVFGVETDYGNVRGRYPVVDATLSRSCLKPDDAERRRHFFDALWLLQEGLVDREQFMGSWAGAFGLTQFMPGTFVEAMADGDGSGKADIIGSAADALATTARYLQGLGWKDGAAGAIEVSAVAAVAASHAPEQAHGCLAVRDAALPCRTLQQWSALGVRRADGSALHGPSGSPAADDRAALLMPAGIDGPAWLITPNYQAVWRYNRADSYALAITLLADALRGAPPPRRRWPTDDGGLSRAEFREVQTLLAQRGHAGVAPDGLNGALTQAAVRAEETRLAWAETGRAGQKLLRALRDAPGRAEPAAVLAAPEAAASSAPAGGEAASSATAAASAAASGAAPAASAAASGAAPAASAAASGSAPAASEAAARPAPPASGPS